jgi:putative NIF3 family GTP cyclohydrolase 1 type 2
LKLAHPYEEPAVDVFSVKTLTDGGGVGRVGTLAQPMTLEALNRLVGEKLRQPHIQFVGEPTQIVSRIGIACGAAAEFLRDAHRAECQGFLTGEARFHSCLEAKDFGIGMILPGHYATERFAMETLAKRLGQQFSQIMVAASETEQDPLQTSSG